MSKKAREMLKTNWHQPVSRLEDQNSAPVENDRNFRNQRCCIGSSLCGIRSLSTGFGAQHAAGFRALHDCTQGTHAQKGNSGAAATESPPIAEQSRERGRGEADSIMK